MRKIILNLAMSLDGFISDEQGGFDWIIGHGDKTSDTEDSFSFEKFIESVDTVVMGSKAYEDCILTGLTAFEGIDIIVATSRRFEERENVTFISGDINKTILDLREKPGKDIWLFGGAGLTDSFIREDIVDQYIIGLIPTILGSGRPLFKGGYNKIDLHLDQFTIDEGVPVIIYSKR
ncbi:dihydrofolate reductase [Acidaminobacter sp. JC074]|uniref:dihydrofolate reductase family protein n=1 Tax=Acidaminobacter sp. JC074 TaxID=2530199 RepID=UPI002105C8D8|nr:dihydrofolate reductase family protein [Acidaminobacter sp. JC074]MCH4890017.1 dihydrofolate reductase [Acidaminobacter sp. JC074]